MEHDAFDELARLVTQELGTRRTVFRLLAGSTVAGVVARFAPAEDAAANHKRKRRGKGRCFGPRPVYCSPTAEEPEATCYPRGARCCGKARGGGACPPGSNCCPPSIRHPTGNCSRPDEVCCPVSQGGGSCPKFAPVCCGPTIQDPLGLCYASGFKCCNSAQGGGSCREEQTCCPPSPGFPNGTCANPGMACPPTGGLSVASGQIQPRRMDPPPGTVARGGAPRLS